MNNEEKIIEMLSALTNEVKKLDQKIDAVEEKLTENITVVEQHLSENINCVELRLSKKIEETQKQIHVESASIVTQLGEMLSEEMHELCNEVAEVDKVSTQNCKDITKLLFNRSHNF